MGGIGKSLARLLLAMENLSGRNLLAFGANVICSFFFLLSSLLKITVEKYHAIHSYSKRSIFMEIFSNLFILVVIRSLIALIDAQSFEK